MLMAIGYRGVDGKGRVGIWGPLLFSTPLLAAWYAFERLDSATRSYRQTIEALAMAPELGGMVPPGHAQRVATLATAMGEQLGLSSADMRDLEMAALLAPSRPGHARRARRRARRPIRREVTAVTGAMLREIRPLVGAGDIVAGDVDDPKRRLAVQVLRIASDYDDLTVRDHVSGDLAVETLRSAPWYVYDERVVVALERVLRGRISRRFLTRWHRLRSGSANRRRSSVRSIGSRRGRPGSAAIRRSRRRTPRSRGGAGLRLALYATSHSPTARMRSPKRAPMSNGLLQHDDVGEEQQLLAGCCGWCFTVACVHDWFFHSAGSFTGMPWLSVITSALHAMPMNTIPMPRSTRLRAANAEDQHVGRDEQAEADVVPVLPRDVKYSRPIWIARPGDEQPAQAPAHSDQALVGAARERAG